VQHARGHKDPNTGQHFIVMEFVEGGNLRDILNIRKKMAPADALRSWRRRRWGWRTPRRWA
jgi:serine/threonine protein kinase